MTTADGAVLGMTQIFGSAPRNRAFNVVLLADGFTAAQQNDFNNACNAFVTAFRATPPYDELSPAINVFRVNVASTDSGADDPAAAGGTGASVRTYFDATFGGNDIRRLLVCNATTALTVAAAQVPEFTVVLVVVNSTVYGGSGGSVGTYSLASGATEIAHPRDGPHRVRPRRRVPVLRRRQRDRPRPPPRGRARRAERHDQHQPQHVEVALGGRVDDRDPDDDATRTAPRSTTGRARCRPARSALFEGAHYYHCGAYRPEYDCKMRDARRAVLPRLPSGDLEPHRAARDAAGPRPYADQRRRPLPRAPRRVRGRAANGRTMSNWWDQSSGWAGWFQVSGGIASPRRSRLAGHGDPPVRRASRPVHGRHRQPASTAAGGTQSTGWSGWFPLGNLQCRPGSTVNVVSRYTDHLDLFTTASDGGRCRPGGTPGPAGPSGSRSRVGSPRTERRSPRSRAIRSTSTCSPSAPTTASTACWWDERVRLGSLVPARQPAAARPDSTVNVVARAPRPPRPVHDRVRRRASCPPGGTRAAAGRSWFQVSGGVASPGFAGDRDRRATPTTSTCSSSAPTTASTAPGGTIRPAGRAGSTSPAASANRAARSPPSPASPSTSTCSPSARTGSSTAPGGTARRGWAGWFQLGVT